MFFNMFTLTQHDISSPRTLFLFKRCKLKVLIAPTNDHILTIITSKDWTSQGIRITMSIKFSFCLSIDGALTIKLGDASPLGE
jgi:hypothetical protein